MEKDYNMPTREVLVDITDKALSSQSALRSEFSNAFMLAIYEATTRFELVAHLRFECKTESEMQKLTKLVDMAGFIVLDEKFEDGFMEIDASFESPAFMAARAAISELGMSAEDALETAEMEISYATKELLAEHFNGQVKEAAENGKFEYRFDIKDVHRNVAKSIHDRLVDGSGFSVRTDYSPEVTKFLVSWRAEGTFVEKGGFYDGSENE